MKLDFYTGLRNWLAILLALVTGALAAIAEMPTGLPDAIAAPLDQAQPFLALLSVALASIAGNLPAATDRQIGASAREAARWLLAGALFPLLGCGGSQAVLSVTAPSGYIEADASGRYAFEAGEGSGDLTGSVGGLVASSLEVADGAAVLPFELTWRASAELGEPGAVVACFDSPLLDLAALLVGDVPRPLCATAGGD